MTQFDFRMRWLNCTALLWVALMSGWPARLDAACFATVSAAAHVQGRIASSALDGPGYRATTILWDALLQRRWAQVVDCRHPEWPAMSVMLEPERLIRNTSAESRPAITTWKSSAESMVHIGDVVRLWRQDEAVRIELQGVAEQSGTVGTRIRVRLQSGFGDNNVVPQRVYGVVCGRDDVEL